MKFQLLLAAASVALPLSHASAGEGHQQSPAGDHAPIGVMGDHRHKQGEWMFSYRYMHMDMDGSRVGTDAIDPTTTATTIPNRFFGVPGQPPTLRVVPLDMTMDMHMFGAMYAPSDAITLMVMANYISKDMDHLTFAGGAGTATLGEFSTSSSGFGDTSASALIKLYSEGIHKLHANIGVSVPTGSITKSGQVLAPTGATPTLRLPYAMQLGSGSYELLPGLTYAARQDNLNWGAQLNGRIRLNDNGESYRLGDTYGATAWVSNDWANWLSTSLRVNWETTESIDGIDPLIVAPVQTADPNNYGGDQAFAYLGVNLIAPSGPLSGHRLAIEYGVPFHRDLNGPQMETDATLTIGWQKSF